jgi:hypothetical protein
MNCNTNSPPKPAAAAPSPSPSPQTISSEELLTYPKVDDDNNISIRNRRVSEICVHQLRLQRLTAGTFLHHSL